MTMIKSANIIIREKPIDLSWEKVQEVIFLAHTDTSKQGGVQISARLSGEEIKEKVGDGICYVALYNDKVVGTCSVTLHLKNAWFHKGIAAYYMLAAVLPEFQGLGIYSRLNEKCDEFALAHGVNVVYLYTAESNFKLQHISERYGFRLISYYVSPKTDYYSVLMAKWLNGCPYPKWYCRCMFFLSKLYIKIRYRAGMVKRFL